MGRAILLALELERPGNAGAADRHGRLIIALWGVEERRKKEVWVRARIERWKQRREEKNKSRASAVGQDGAAVGKGGAAVGKGGAAVGKGGAAVGKGGAAVGQGGAAVGQGGAAVDQGGAAAQSMAGPPANKTAPPTTGGQAAAGKAQSPPGQWVPNPTASQWVPGATAGQWVPQPVPAKKQPPPRQPGLQSQWDDPGAGPPGLSRQGPPKAPYQKSSPPGANVLESGHNDPSLPKATAKGQLGPTQQWQVPRIEAGRFQTKV